ncbi:MAG: alkyl hydroperoxide reductase, subunit [Verrucomicrobiota bacterium]|jgi:peroxiredoxin (alkyl hydroperoxide reductase subunit C)
MDFRTPSVISPGMNVPDFSMDTYEPATSSFGRVSLTQLRQQGLWTVLVFYPADFTFVCPTELADIADHFDELQALGVKIISVSADTKYAHLAWRNSEKLLQNVRFSMGADPAGGVSKLFGAYDEAAGLTRRGTLIISPAGQLVSAEVTCLNLGRDASELLRKLKAITYLVQHPDEACPAKWQPGQPTIKPSEKLVGHVFEALAQAQ